jgi:hypothetical protein
MREAGWKAHGKPQRGILPAMPAAIARRNSGNKRGILAACMKHFYENVPRLGNVAVSRHAQSQMLDAGISQEAFDRVLLDPIQPDAPDGQDILWRERDGLRLVILMNPTPNRGAKLVKTVYRVQAQAKSIAGRHR